jgi:hypothetical protein
MSDLTAGPKTPEGVQKYKALAAHEISLLQANNVLLQVGIDNDCDDDAAGQKATIDNVARTIDRMRAALSALH